MPRVAPKDHTVRRHAQDVILVGRTSRQGAQAAELVPGNEDAGADVGLETELRHLDPGQLLGAGDQPV